MEEALDCAVTRDGLLTTGDNSECKRDGRAIFETSLDEVDILSGGEGLRDTLRTLGEEERSRGVILIEPILIGRTCNRVAQSKGEVIR